MFCANKRKSLEVFSGVGSQILRFCFGNLYLSVIRQQQFESSLISHLISRNANNCIYNYFFYAFIEIIVNSVSDLGPHCVFAVFQNQAPVTNLKISSKKVGIHLYTHF